MREKRVRVKGWALYCYGGIFGEADHMAIYGCKKMAQTVKEMETLESPEWAKDGKLKIVPCTVSFSVPKKLRSAKR